MRCPEGHESAATDYCDVCGTAMGAAPAASSASSAASAPPPAPSSADCPSCGTSNAPDALFCEACGYDFTTGQLPQPLAAPAGDTQAEAVVPEVAAPAPTPAPAPAATPSATANPSPALTGWVAEVWIDPDWYTDQQSSDPLPSPGLPLVVRLDNTSVLIGRHSRSRGITPDIDLSSDNGISRRHAQLTTDGSRWWVEDLGSSNGTFVGSATGGLPQTPVPPGQKREVGPDDRIYLGAWSRVIVRRAAPGEV